MLVGTVSALNVKGSITKSVKIGNNTFGGTVTETAECTFSTSSWRFSGLSCVANCPYNYMYNGTRVTHSYSSDRKTVTSNYTVTYTESTNYTNTTVSGSQKFYSSGSYVY